MHFVSTRSWQKKNPELHERDRAGSLVNYSRALSEEGQDSAALETARKALEIYEKLSKKDPAEYNRLFALTLGNYARLLDYSGEYAEAIERARQSLEVYGRLASVNPDRIEPELAQALSLYASFLSERGEVVDALGHSLRALQIREKLAIANPDRFEDDWAHSMRNYSAQLVENGLYADAVTIARKAIEISGRLRNYNPARYTESWVNAIGNLAEILVTVGEYQEALVWQRMSRLELTKLVARKRSWFGEHFYVVSLGVHWLSWLAEDLPEQSRASIPSPDLTWLRPHRLPVLTALVAWVEACFAEGEVQRSDAFTTLLTLCLQLDGSPQFKQVEEFWLVASAWHLSHNPSSEQPARLRDRLNSQWSRFLERRNGRVPNWMRDVSHRMEFQWPS